MSALLILAYLLSFRDEADTVSVNSVSSRGSVTSSDSDFGYSNKRVQFINASQTPSSKRSKTGL